MKQKLTKKVVDATGPAQKMIMIWDTEISGFGLKITPKGSKTYLLYYRTSVGKQRKPTIGKHGNLTVDQARKIAKQWSAQVAMGIDISGQRQLDRTAETVSDLAKRYLQDTPRSTKNRAVSKRIGQISKTMCFPS